MKNRLLTFAFTITVFSTLFYGCAGDNSNTEDSQSMTSTTENDSNGEWQVLFDGESTDHWRGYGMDDFPEEGWVIEDNALVFRAPESGSSGLDIITKETYSDFELTLDWMISEGGNSGIFYHVLEQDRAIYWSGPEFQILDNVNHPDANMGVDGNRKSASLYDLIPAKPQNTLPAGQWNSVRIISDGPIIQHWQNGEMVVEYERWNQEWFDMLHESKFNCYPEFGAIRSGHIGLQDHGDEVKFRNIKIRSL